MVMFKKLAITTFFGFSASQSCPRSGTVNSNSIYASLFPEATAKTREPENLTFEEGDALLKEWQKSVSEANEQRIVNGYDTPAGEAPFYVRIMSCTNGASCGTCGASWISSTTILTAAHCHSSTATDIYYYKNPTDNSLQPSYASPAVDSWMFHPCWDENGSLFQENYDVLILRVTDASPSMPIRLATPENQAALSTSYPSGENNFVSYGFGRTAGDGSDPTPAVLQRTYGIEYFNCTLSAYAYGVTQWFRYAGPKILRF